ncbi:hypothetical protein B0H11DRAFT_1933525 [Mycena galericulata]|nr:hypothetical protein B0H11DRAFT_1933525 [Mycena galericulata]
MSPALSLRIERAFYAEVGTSTLDRVLFLLVVDELRGKPIGFSKNTPSRRSRERCTHKKLCDLSSKSWILDGVSKVDGGFYEFLGALWIHYGQNTAEMVSVLYPIFQPLLDAAGNAYLAFYSDNPTKKPKKPEKHRQAKLPADLQFLVNVRKAQRARASLLPPATPQSSARRYPSSNLFLSPTSSIHFEVKAEQGDSPPYVRDSDHEPSVLELLMPSGPQSPMVFTPDPSPSFANHADILGADLNDFMIFNNHSPIHVDNTARTNSITLGPGHWSLTDNLNYSLLGILHRYASPCLAWPSPDPNDRLRWSWMRPPSAAQTQARWAPRSNGILLLPLHLCLTPGQEKTYQPLYVEGSPEQLLDPALLVMEKTPDRPRPPLTPNNYNYKGRQLGTPFKVAARVLDFMENV